MKMKFFQFIRNDLANLSIDLNQPARKHFLNKYILFSNSLTWLCILSLCVFIFHEANSFDEYTEPIYMLCTLITCNSQFLLTSFQAKGMFEFIQRIEEVINSSEIKIHFFMFLSRYWECSTTVAGIMNSNSKPMYKTTNALVEKCC